MKSRGAIVESVMRSWSWSDRGESVMRSWSGLGIMVLQKEFIDGLLKQGGEDGIPA